MSTTDRPTTSPRHLAIAVVAIVVGLAIIIGLTLATLGGGSGSANSADTTTEAGLAPAATTNEAGSSTAPSTPPVAGGGVTPSTVPTTGVSPDPAPAPATSTSAGTPTTSSAVPAAPQSGAPVNVEVEIDPADLPGYEYCVDGEYAGTEWGIVISAPATSSYNTLPVYAGPDLAEPIWYEFQIGDTVALAPVTDFGGCVYRTDGMVFWAVWLDEGDFGWVDSYHVAPSTEPGWATEPEVDVVSDPVLTGEPVLVRPSCVTTPSLPFPDCVPVESDADANITSATFPNEETQLLVTLDCVYGGDGFSCMLLNSAGITAADNYGLGNSLSMAPTEVLRGDCVLGTSAWGALSCAELATRE